MKPADVFATWDRVLVELRANGLDLSPEGTCVPWTLELDKASVRFGCCHFGSRRITLSRRLVELNAEKEIEACMRHEIAHALVGEGHGHDETWRRMAIRCGDDGKRCYDDATVATPEAPWQATCPGCGRIAKRRRPPKQGRLISCGVCRPGTFDARFLLKFESNLAPALARIAAEVPGQSNASVTVNGDRETVARVLSMRMRGMG